MRCAACLRRFEKIKKRRSWIFEACPICEINDFQSFVAWWVLGLAWWVLGLAWWVLESLIPKSGAM